MHLTLLNYLLIDLGLGLRPVFLRSLLLLVEPSEVEVVVHLLEVLVIFIRAEVDVVELLEVGDLLAPVGEAVGRLVLEEGELGSALGDLQHLVGSLGLHETLLGIAYLLDLPSLRLRQSVGELVEGR